jgi:hypothetical protein
VASPSSGRTGDCVVAHRPVEVLPHLGLSVLRPMEDCEPQVRASDPRPVKRHQIRMVRRRASLFATSRTPRPSHTPSLNDSNCSLRVMPANPGALFKSRPTYSLAFEIPGAVEGAHFTIGAWRPSFRRGSQCPDRDGLCTCGGRDSVSDCVLDPPIDLIPERPETRANSGKASHHRLAMLRVLHSTRLSRCVSRKNEVVEDIARKTARGAPGQKRTRRPPDSPTEARPAHPSETGYIVQPRLWSAHSSG